MSLRVGVLGAARIVPEALLVPARHRADVEVVALGARDADRARAFAAAHGVPRGSGYDAVLADPEVDAVYIALPAALHGEWTIAALEAGKHVLCEKPFTANGEEAAEVAAVAGRSDRVLMQAFHYRYHGLVARLLAILASGELGAVERIDAWFDAPLLPPGDIRWNLALGGGALMDLGCYPLHLVRTLLGAEPVVLSARAWTRGSEVDRLLEAELVVPGGATARVRSSMLSRHVLGIGARVTGTEGTLAVTNFVSPHRYSRIAVRTPAMRRVEHVARRPSTYQAQLDAFVGAVQDGRPFPTDAADAVATMRLIDDCYRASGLEPRRPARAFATG